MIVPIHRIGAEALLSVYFSRMYAPPRQPVSDLPCWRFAYGWRPLAAQLYDRALGYGRCGFRYNMAFDQGYAAGYIRGCWIGFDDSYSPCRRGLDLLLTESLIPFLFAGWTQAEDDAWQPWRADEPYALEQHRWWPASEPLPMPEPVPVEEVRRDAPPVFIDHQSMGGMIDAFA